MSRAAHCDRSNSAAGISLIEVVVALMLLAASLAAIGSLVATTSHGVRSVEQRVALVETARGIATYPPGVGFAADQSRGETAGYRWRVDVRPWSVGPIPANSPWVPMLVAARVQSPSGAVLELDTIRLQRRAGQ